MSAIEIKDKSGQPRDDQEIRDAINVIERVMIRCHEYPPELVVMAPTIREGLRELLRYREAP